MADPMDASAAVSGLGSLASFFNSQESTQERMDVAGSAAPVPDGGPPLQPLFVHPAEWRAKLAPLPQPQRQAMGFHMPALPALDARSELSARLTHLQLRHALTGSAVREVRNLIEELRPDLAGSVALPDALASAQPRTEALYIHSCETCKTSWFADDEPMSCPSGKVQHSTYWSRVEMFSLTEGIARLLSTDRSRKALSRTFPSMVSTHVERMRRVHGLFAEAVDGATDVDIPLHMFGDGFLPFGKYRNRRLTRRRRERARAGSALPRKPVKKHSSWTLGFRVMSLPLPLRDRAHNLLMGAIVFGPRQPASFEPVMERLVDELLMMWNAGSGRLFQLGTDGAVRVRAVLTGVSMDTKALQKLVGLSAYPHLSCCPFCTYRGTPMETLSRHPAYGNFKDLAAFLYESEGTEHRRTQTDFDPQNPVLLTLKGIRMVSCLARLPYLDISSLYAVDAMHLLYLGVARHVTHLVLGLDENSPRMVSDTARDRVNQLLAEFELPPELNATRPKDITQHMRELGLSDDDCLFLRDLADECDRLVSATAVSESECEANTRRLIALLVRFEQLFGTARCTPTMHMFAHCWESIRWFGPLSDTWTFGTERLNLELVRASEHIAQSPEHAMVRTVRDLGLVQRVHPEWLDPALGGDVVPDSARVATTRTPPALLSQLGADPPAGLRHAVVAKLLVSQRLGCTLHAREERPGAPSFVRYVTRAAAVAPQAAYGRLQRLLITSGWPAGTERVFAELVPVNVGPRSADIQQSWVAVGSPPVSGARLIYVPIADVVGSYFYSRQQSALIPTPRTVTHGLQDRLQDE